MTDFYFVFTAKTFKQSTLKYSKEPIDIKARIGPEGIELIFKESIRINGKDGEEKEAIVDTTVQEKNITYPTDAKLHEKIIEKCHKIAGEENIELRQSYKRTLKKLELDRRHRTNPKNIQKAKKADRKIKTIAGRLVRELKRKLEPNNKRNQDFQKYTQKSYLKNVKTITKYTAYMKQMYNVSVKGSSIKNLNLETKYQ